MDADRERELLSAYEREYAEAVERSNEARAEVLSLFKVVDALRHRVESNPAVKLAKITPEPLDPDRLTHAQLQPDNVMVSVRRGRPTLPSLILEVLSDGEARPVGQIIDEMLQRKSMADQDPPTRNSITNRLNEMAARGELEKVERGVYRLAPKAGEENGNGVGAQSSVQPEGPWLPSSEPLGSQMPSLA